MRLVYALLGLVKRWGPERVETACARAMDAEAALSAGLIGRMLERATESDQTTVRPGAGPPGRFARDPGHFASDGFPSPGLWCHRDADRASSALSEGGSLTEGPAMSTDTRTSR